MDASYSCSAMDANRLKEVYYYGFFGIVLLCASVLYSGISLAPTLVFYRTCGTYLVTVALMQYAQFRFAKKSYKRWNASGGEVTFGPSLLFLIWQVMSSIVLIAGAAVIVMMVVAGGDSTTPRVAYAAAMRAFFFLVMAIMSLVTFPFSAMTEPEIILNSNGIIVWPAGRYRTRINWGDRPRMIGGRRSNGGMFVLIEDKNGLQYSFPMSYLPLGYVQFEKVIDLYSDNPDAREYLGHREGLVHVRRLMYSPVSFIVEDLNALSENRGEPTVGR